MKRSLIKTEELDSTIVPAIGPTTRGTLTPVARLKYS